MPTSASPALKGHCLPWTGSNFDNTGEEGGRGQNGHHFACISESFLGQSGPSRLAILFLGLFMIAA